MVNDRPLVSVIIPTYKRPDKLDRAIKSVLNQTYRNIEIVVVDDNNEKDNFRKETEEFMKKYDLDNIKYLKHKENQGGASARNTGIKNSNGEIVAFLDDDDEWFPDNLNKKVNKLLNLPDDYGVCFSSYIIVTNNLKYKENKPKSSGNIYKDQLKRDHVSPTSAVIAKKECFSKAGLFDTRLPARQDYDMWFRISKYYKFSYLNEALLYIHKSNDSVSDSYERNFKGTKIILDKIKKELKQNQYDLNFKKKVLSIQYKYLGRMSYSRGAYKKGRKYLIKSFKNKFSLKTFSLFILTFLGPKLWKSLGKIRNKFYSLKNNKGEN